MCVCVSIVYGDGSKYGCVSVHQCLLGVVGWKPVESWCNVTVLLTTLLMLVSML